MRREKRKEKGLYKDLFKEPWCPLFGSLPLIEEPPSTIKSRCIDIILNARLLWKVYELVNDLEYEGMPELSNLYFCNFAGINYRGNNNWPEPEEVPKYPKDALLSARAVFRNAYRIMLDAQFYSGGGSALKAWYKKKNDTADLVRSPDQVSEDLLSSIARGFIGVSQDINGYKVFAILAIKEAWEALKEILYYRRSEDSPEVMEHVQAAGSLLARAEKEAMKPFVERFLKHQKVRSETIKKHNITKKIKGWDQLEKILPDIVKKRQGKSISDIFKAMQQHINYDKEYGIPELNCYKKEWKRRTFHDKIKAIKETLQ